MEVIVRGTPEEIAALVQATQERQWSKDELETKLTEILLEFSKGHDDFQYS